MDIIDAHVHIFRRISGRVAQGNVTDAGYGIVRFDSGETCRILPPISEKTSFTPEALLKHMDWLGVARAVLLQAGFYGDHNREVAEAVLLSEEL